MSEIYFASKAHRDMVERERKYNLTRLEKIREMIDSGELAKMNKEFFVKNELWEKNSDGHCIGFVACIGIECSAKDKSTSYTCPLAQDECWWVYANQWRKKNEKRIRNRWTFMRKHSDI